MPKPKPLPHESEFYPVVARWLESDRRCFKTAINKGLQYSRGDVFGVRDIGGSLSGSVETFAVEVKRGSEPFATASGQALGYKVYAHRVYLADLREDGFSDDEIAIASHIGIGLVSLRPSGHAGRGFTCREVLSSPRHEPLAALHLRLLDKLELGQCRFCGSFFELGRNFSRTRKRMRDALADELGMRFWSDELSKRKLRLGIVTHDESTTYERRYVCPDCVGVLSGIVRDAAMPD